MDDGHGNMNDKQALGLDMQTSTTLQVQHTVFGTFLAIATRLWRETTQFYVIWRTTYIDIAL